MNRGPHDAYTSADGTRIYVGAQYGGSGRKRILSTVGPAR
jgi:hypothetical protein